MQTSPEGNNKGDGAVPIAIAFPTEEAPGEDESDSNDTAAEGKGSKDGFNLAPEADAQAGAATKINASISSPWRRGRYYAVRVGYAVQSPLTVKIRSAIFLHWEDAHQFVDSIGHSSGHRAEYATFNSLGEAESYLVEEERDNSLNRATAAEETNNAGDSAATFTFERGDSTMPMTSNITTTTVRQQDSFPKNVAKSKIRINNNDAPLAPSWDIMYERLASHKAETGTLDVNKDVDEELFAWIKTQKKTLLHHFQNKPVVLSNEQLTKLKSLGYGQSRPGIVRASGVVDTISAEEKWNSMLEELKAYKERNNGSMVFPYKTNSLPKPVKAIKYWVGEQRREFKKLSKGNRSNLSAQRMQRLTAIGFDLQPHSEEITWEQRMADLVCFIEEHGHCRPPKQHPELGSFVSKIRQYFREREEGKTNSLTDERVKELMGLGFVFSAGKSPNFASTVKKTWEERFQELLEFKEVHGHTVVPQLSGSLGGWVRMQRIAYKKFKAGEKSTMTVEKALKLTEVSFCFDASARFK